MKKQFSNHEIAQWLGIPDSIIYDLLEAAHLLNREFDHYDLCHYAFTRLGHKFGQYNGTEIYDLGVLLGKKSLTGKIIEFDILVWYQTVIPYLKTLIDKDLLDYEILNDYDQYIGNQPYPAGRALKVMLDIRRPATMSFYQMMATLNCNNYSDFDDE